MNYLLTKSTRFNYTANFTSNRPQGNRAINRTHFVTSPNNRWISPSSSFSSASISSSGRGGVYT